MQSLRELIEIEQEKAKRINAQPIAEVEKAIELLQQKLTVLTQTDKGRKLQDEYDALVVQLIPNPFGITPFTQVKTFAPRGFGQSVGCLS